MASEFYGTTLNLWSNFNACQYPYFLRIDFYSTNHFVSSHYPLMILTNTKYIFGKRIRRLRKTVAFDNSSDGEESINTFSGRFSTLGFLRPSQMAESIGSSSPSEISRFSNFSRGISYESSIHNVYEGKIQI